MLGLAEEPFRLELHTHYYGKVAISADFYIVDVASGHVIYNAVVVRTNRGGLEILGMSDKYKTMPESGNVIPRESKDDWLLHEAATKRFFKMYRRTPKMELIMHISDAHTKCGGKKPLRVGHLPLRAVEAAVVKHTKLEDLPLTTEARAELRDMKPVLKPLPVALFRALRTKWSSGEMGIRPRPKYVKPKVRRLRV